MQINPQSLLSRAFLPVDLSLGDYVCAKTGVKSKTALERSKRFQLARATLLTVVG